MVLSLEDEGTVIHPGLLGVIGFVWNNEGDAKVNHEYGRGFVDDVRRLLPAGLGDPPCRPSGG
jgi:hypothetical protein